MKTLRTVSTHRRKRQLGSALVETALVFTTTITLVLFIVDMGRLLMTQQFITERARVGARNGVLNNWTTTQVANYVVFGSTTAGSSGVGFMGLTPSQVTVNQIADSGIGDARLQVKVSGVPLISLVPFLAGTYTAPPIVATAPMQSGGTAN